MPKVKTKVFNIPFSGEAATVILLAKHDTTTCESIVYTRDKDGTITNLVNGDYILSSFSVSNGFATLTFSYVVIDLDTIYKCCIIPDIPNF